MRAMWKIASVWGLVGAGMAACLFVVLIVTNAYGWGISADIPYFTQQLALVLWPASFWLMATEGASWLATVVVLVISILANFLLYFFVGLIITIGWRVVRRRVHPLA